MPDANLYALLAANRLSFALAAAAVLTGCFSTPLWSSDRASADVTTVRVSRVYEQRNGTTVTVTPPEDGGRP